MRFTNHAVIAAMSICASRLIVGLTAFTNSGRRPVTSTISAAAATANLNSGEIDRFGSAFGGRRRRPTRGFGWTKRGVVATTVIPSIRGGESVGGSSNGSRLSSSATAEAVEMAEASAPVEKFRIDYEPLPYVVTKLSLDFDIRDGETIVTSKLFIDPNPAVDGTRGDLVLDGEDDALELLSIQLNGRDLVEGINYVRKPDAIVLLASTLGEGEGSPVLETRVKVVPETNTQLSGLYKSGPMYCTQCEATGFRRITYYPDRPDNMAVFESVRIEAYEDDFPVLLGNGNKIEEGSVDADGDSKKRHFAVWSDPHPKPSYLFCIVAGNLASIKSKHVTSPSGREVHLEIFSEKENVHKLDHAMTSLVKSMVWDEEKFGLEYDLDVYNVVAVNDFNMGAMENKGLNVFNTAYVLADPRSATDTDYERIESVIGHEYFHNWTGNRVTCRDWFQLTLKEGLTVFRDQQFSGDMMNSHAVKRIEDVRALKASQFREDAGPMSHPVRPESYISMDNFYTATVYSKGAEVVRMYSVLLGTDGFRKGMDLYFERYDGSAVTCDDLRNAMADANSIDLTQFGSWYSTPGTPTVTYESRYDAGEKKFFLTLSQESKSDTPLHIPVTVGLLDKSTGEEVVPSRVLELKEVTQTFEFDGLDAEDVVPSLLRGFSAPVKLVRSSSATDEDEEADWAFLAARDTDGFNRWESGQKLYASLIFQTMRDDKGQGATQAYVFEAFRRSLAQNTDDYSIQAYALTLPLESTLAEELDGLLDPLVLHKARGDAKKIIARKFYDEIRSKYDELTAAMESNNGGEGGIQLDTASIGQRRLRNVLLDYLCSVKETDEEVRAAADIADAQFRKAAGMTDRYAALSSIASMDGNDDVIRMRESALKQFYDDADGDALVLNKWFMVQALADLPDALDRVNKLLDHPDFTLTNPNRCRSLISAFSMNVAHFHAEDGSGYRFLVDAVAQIDKLNPQMSSRMGGALIQWRRYNEDRGALMKAELEKLASMKPISDDLFEVVSRGLK